MVLLVAFVSTVVVANEIITFVAEQVDFTIKLNYREEKQFENPIVLINNRTYLPLRETADTLGIDVKWDGETQTIDIITGEEKRAESFYKDIDEIIMEKYPDEMIRSIVFNVNHFQQDSVKYPAQCVRYCGRYFYTAFKSVEGNLYFKMYDTRSGAMVSYAAWNLDKTYSLDELLARIRLGETTYEEIVAMNPAGNFGHFKSQYDDTMQGMIWTNDGFLLNIYSDNGKFVDYVEVQEENSFPLVYGYLLQKDLVKILPR